MNPFETTLDQFISVYDVFDVNERKLILSELDGVDWQNSTFYNSQKRESYSNNNEPKAYLGLIQSHEWIMSKFYDVIGKYILEEHVTDYFCKWNGFSYPKYLRYHPGCTIIPHCDHIHSLFDGNIKGIPFLSLVTLLNDDFVGGDFMIGDCKIELKAGQTILFPSSFLYPHQVTTVLEGIRNSIAVWVY